MIDKSAKGSALVQALIAVGMIGMIGATMATMSDLFSSQQRLIGQKFEILDLQQALLQTMVDSNAGTCQLAGKTFNSANPNTPVDLNKVTHGCGAGTPVIAQAGQKLPGSSLTVQSVQLVNISPVGTDQFKATLQVTFDSASSKIALKPATVGVRFYTDPASPPGAKAITTSSASSVPTFACVSGSYRPNSGSRNIRNAMGGYTPSSFNEVFRTTANSGEYGIGCQAEWQLTGCSFETNGFNASESSSFDTDLMINDKCWVDDEERDLNGEIYAICCKILMTP